MRLLLSIICFVASLPSGAIAGPKEALEVVDKWTKAFAASDVDAIVSLNAPDALFMGTGSQTVVTEPAAVRKYFEDALLTRKPRAAPISSSEVSCPYGSPCSARKSARLLHGPTGRPEAS